MIKMLRCATHITSCFLGKITVKHAMAFSRVTKRREGVDQEEPKSDKYKTIFQIQTPKHLIGRVIRVFGAEKVLYSTVFPDCTCLCPEG